MMLPALASFHLHQAAENFIAAYLLVKTGHKPQEHNLEKLYGMIQKLNSGFSKWFNLKDKEEKHLFKLLKRAYTDSRYKKDYTITLNQIELITQKDLLLARLITTYSEEEYGGSLI